MTPLTLTARAPRKFSGISPVLSLVAQIISIHGQRRALACLDAAALTDIGLTYSAAKSEANRPFWDIPAN
jgi:uncharacterized protein YjiS (DUF1127 family)